MSDGDQAMQAARDRLASAARLERIAARMPPDHEMQASTRELARRLTAGPDEDGDGDDE